MEYDTYPPEEVIIQQWFDSLDQEQQHAFLLTELKNLDHHVQANRSNTWEEENTRNTHSRVITDELRLLRNLGYGAIAEAIVSNQLENRPDFLKIN